MAIEQLYWEVFFTKCKLVIRFSTVSDSLILLDFSVWEVHISSNPSIKHLSFRVWGSSLLACLCKWHSFVPFCGWAVLHHVYEPFLCRWTSRLPPCSGYSPCFAGARRPLSFPGGTSGKEPASQCRRCEIWVQSLGRKDPLEKGMATHSSILAWRIPGQRSPAGWTWLKPLSMHAQTS